MTNFSNLAKIVYKRTYARPVEGDPTRKETWPQLIDRVLRGNQLNVPVSDNELNRLRYYMLNRKAIPAGRGLWFSGAPAHPRVGGCALSNCYYFSADSWENFVIAQDMLMLGGGVGLGVEFKYVSKLPRVKPSVHITHTKTPDADFLVPDSREGWCELLRRVLESFFVTGRSFTYSTICVRDYGEPINGFGGVASGPLPLIEMVNNISSVLRKRENRSVRPIDAADLICIIGQMVIAGNVRRSAIIVLGDPYDKDYLVAKRWSLGNIPNWRASANFSVICDDIDDLHPLFWKTYEDGEPFGIVNRTNMRKYARMGELKKDVAVGVNPCGEATLSSGENCNLVELALPNLANNEEACEAAALMFRYAKRVSMSHFHQPSIDAAIKKYMRVGVGITGCMASPLFNPTDLNEMYSAIGAENARYSAELGVPESIRTTVIKPSGTVSKVLDMKGYEGIHPALSRYIIQRVRFSSTDPLIEALRAAGHHIEPRINFDGTLDRTTSVVDFYEKAPNGYPVADENWDTWRQLDTVLMAQKYWADQSISVTVYYKKEEIEKIKEWLRENLAKIKTISFLPQFDHGFKQAPKEPISEATYEKLSRKVRPLDDALIGGDELVADVECAGGVCPVR